MKNLKRIIQLITGIHRIHHIRYSYGFKMPFINIAYFDNYGWIDFRKEAYKTAKRSPLKGYHNCTLTNRY